MWKKQKGKEKDKETEENLKKRVKIMWDSEKSANGMGSEKEGRFEWRIEGVGAGEKVVLEAQWEVTGETCLRLLGGKFVSIE